MSDQLDDMCAEITRLAEAPFPWRFSSWSYGVRYALESHAGPGWLLVSMLSGRPPPPRIDPIPFEPVHLQCTRLLHLRAQLDDLAERSGDNPARQLAIAACRQRAEATLEDRLAITKRTLTRWSRVTLWSGALGSATVIAPQLAALVLDLTGRPRIGSILLAGSIATISLAVRLTGPARSQDALR